MKSALTDRMECVERTQADKEIAAGSAAVNAGREREGERERKSYKY